MHFIPSSHIHLLCLFIFLNFSAFLQYLSLTFNLFMASYDQQQGKPLPKFGEWDVNDPASAEGFTVIFNKARDEKKIASVSGRFPSQRRHDSRKRKTQKKCKSSSNSKKKWFCFGP